MYLTNSSSTPTLWQIPSGASIAAGGSLIFYADGETSSTTAAGRHTSFTLSASGGAVYLYNTDGATLVSSVAYPALAANVTYLVTRLAFGSTAAGVYGGTTSLAVTLTDGGLALSGKTISFSVDGSIVGTAVTNTSGVATLAGVSLTGLQAGTYPGYVTAAFAGDGTDAASSASTSLTVTAAPLTITADNQTMVYCSTLPTLTASYAGFVNGDTSASLTTLPTLNTTATSASPVGTYAITANGAADSNYTISYAAGTLTVTTDPTVTAMLVENGLTERSYVDQLTFQFSKPVSSKSAVPMTLTDFGTAGGSMSRSH